MVHCVDQTVKVVTTFSSPEVWDEVGTPSPVAHAKSAAEDDGSLPAIVVALRAVGFSSDTPARSDEGSTVMPFTSVCEDVSFE